MADGIAARFDNRQYQASEERLLDAVLAMPSTSLLAQPGRRLGGGLEVTVGGTPESATVQPGGGILTDTAGGGSFRFVIPSVVAIQLATRPSTGNSRIDVVYAVVKNVDVRPADTVREVDIAVATGTAGSSPTAPSIPTGALQLARLAIPASGSVSVSAAPPRIAALGGVVPVANPTERDAILNTYNGLVVFREDTGTYEGRVTGNWVKLATYVPYASGSFFAPAAGAGVVAGRAVLLSGAMVTIHLELTVPAYSAGADFNLGIGTLAAELRPVIYSAAWQGYPNNIGGLVDPDGSVRIRSATGAGAAGSTVVLTGSWPVF